MHNQGCEKWMVLHQLQGLSLKGRRRCRRISLLQLQS
ncbi:hypothetical protein LINPERPRIM_LOCUS17477 [Linum perenne]